MDDLFGGTLKAIINQEVACLLNMPQAGYRYFSDLLWLWPEHEAATGEGKFIFLFIFYLFVQSKWINLQV